MLRRLTSGSVARCTALTASKPTSAVAESRRHLEPMSVWYLSSWAFAWYYSFFFWFPLLWADIMMPTFTNNKLPMIHFMTEKRAEAKLRRVLDETYTEWTTDLEASHITDAITRTF